MISMLSPGWLWLLLLLPIYWFVVFHGEQGKVFYFASLLENSWKQKVWSVVYHGLISTLFIGLVIALAQPTMTITNQTVTKEGVDIVLALDVSYSMQANDFSPNRIEAAKRVLSQFVDAVETDRVGMIVFAWAPFSAVPLTFDYEIVASILQRTSTETIDQNAAGMQGTAVWDAMLSALTLLEKGQEDLTEETRMSRQQVLVLLTDGEANVWVDPTVVAWLAKDNGVTVYTVWIGSIEWWTIAYNTLFGTRTQRVPWVDEASLKSIAEITNGKYRRATDESTFREIFTEIAALEKTEATQENVTANRDLTGFVLIGVLFCIVVLWLFVFVVTPIADPFRLQRQRKALFWSLIACLLALIVWQMQWWSQSAMRQVMALLDVSTSMEVEDVSYQSGRVSRLDTAKTAIQRIIQQLPWTKLWVGIFAWESVSVVPLTTNVDFVMTMLWSLDARALTKQWTDIVQAIEQWVARFVDESWWVLLILTDGWDEEYGSLSEQLKEQIEQKNIRLVLLHIGTEEGWPIPVGTDRQGRVVYKQFDGRQVVSSIDKNTVRNFIRDLWGEYIWVETVKDLSTVVDTIQQSTVQSEAIWSVDGYQSTRLTKWGAFGALLCWILFIGVQTKRWQEK